MTDPQDQLHNVHVINAWHSVVKRVIKASKAIEANKVSMADKDRKENQACKVNPEMLEARVVMDLKDQ
jgi:hypothetical protein